MQTPIRKVGDFSATLVTIIITGEVIQEVECLQTTLRVVETTVSSILACFGLRITLFSILKAYFDFLDSGNTGTLFSNNATGGNNNSGNNGGSTTGNGGNGTGLFGGNNTGEYWSFVQYFIWKIHIG